ncbi:MAG: hypothetical protein Q9209_000314 [Squamulea sp. 1 TL-2023]
MEVETAALVRAAEDILSLTRMMKEMWLFGKLETLGTNEAEERAEESARGVEEGLRKLMGAEKAAQCPRLPSLYHVTALNRLLLYHLKFPKMSTSVPPPSPQSLPPLTLIVASTPTLGIGLNGSFPWPTLKADIQFFARVTKRPPSSSQTPSDQSNGPENNSTLRNAVAMGRKTFDSIPPKFRPLKDRINVVITRSPDSTSVAPYKSNKDVVIASSILDGLQRLREQHEGLGRVFVIGGAEIYRQAIGLKECERVLWTRLSGEWECDTWFPKGVVGDGVEEDAGGKHGWKRRTRGELEEWTQEEGVGGVRKEGNVDFEVSMWERKQDG